MNWTTPVVSVTYADDGTAFTASQTNQVHLDVQPTDEARIRDYLPDGRTVVGRDGAATYEGGGTRSVEFDATVRDATLTYFVEAPSGATNTGRSTFGPVEYNLDGE